MAEDIVVPALGESVTEATVAKWFKSPGEAVAVDEPLLELETDKVSVEVNAKAAGVLSEIVADAGAEVEVGALLGRIDANGKGAAPKARSDAPDPKTEPAPPKADAPKAATETPKPEPAPASPPTEAAEIALAPAVRKLVEDNRLDPGKIPASGKDGRLTKGDVLAYIEKGGVDKNAPAPQAALAASRETGPREAGPREAGPREERVKMTRLRRRIAERLKEAQNTAAMLTTFNEADMSTVVGLRNRLQDSFVKKHGVKLGFMSFFVKACMVALREVPEVNAEIAGDDIIYKNHYDIGVAVSTENGLIVPVLRDADAMGFAEIETKIAELANRARDGKLAMEDLTGGTFTITNGGIFGSLLSTPILNPPQSGILGMHAIVKRPVAVGDNIEIRPMMNLALTYDHRIVDGREAVTFLVRVKECIEQPERILLDI